MTMDERIEDFREIVAYARSKGYVNYDEINEMLPAELSSTVLPTCTEAESSATAPGTDNFCTWTPFFRMS